MATRNISYVPVGISEIVVTTPGLHITAENLAEVLAARTGGNAKETLSKIKGGEKGRGLQVDMFRLPGYSESNFTFAADALDTFLRRMMGDPESRALLEANPIRSIYAGTESAIDKSRPDIMISRGMVESQLLMEDPVLYAPVLKQIRHSRVTEQKFACVGGLLSLDDAVTRVSRNAMLGRNESSIVIAMDTAIYDDKKAPGAEATQGGAAVLMWVTPRPLLLEVHPESSAHNVTFPDFTKVGSDTPFVHGKPSEKIFVYDVGSAAEDLEHRLRDGHDHGTKGIEFILCHVPFPEQASYLAGFQFAHFLKRAEPALFEKITNRENVGKEPVIGDASRLTKLIGDKFRSFNQGGIQRAEREIVEHIGNDPDIKLYWEWLKRLRSTPEFEYYKKSLHIDEALVIPKTVGNSYTASLFVSLSSYLLNYSAEMKSESTQRGVLLGYGSGSQSLALPVTILASPETIRKHMHVEITPDKNYGLDAKQYTELHAVHLTGDAQRLITQDNLVDKDRILLRNGIVSRGYHVVNLNSDGTGLYVHSDGVDTKPVIRRY
jgi:3-hydroxy-3-methylglutaryl CoA synthase